MANNDAYQKGQKVYREYLKNRIRCQGLFIDQLAYREKHCIRPTSSSSSASVLELDNEMWDQHKGAKTYSSKDVAKIYIADNLDTDAI